MHERETEKRDLQSVIFKGSNVVNVNVNAGGNSSNFSKKQAHETSSPKGS